jgi:hypothetical protein
MSICTSSYAELLAEPFPLTAEHIAHYRRDGFIKLKDVLDPGLLQHYGQAISAAVAERARDLPPLSERGTYGKAFQQISNLWEFDAVVREFSMGRRLAHIAAQLMEVDGVRMYHDQALFKEPGGGFTPWHADQFYWPLSTDRSVTAWIPLQTTPLEMGPLQFSVGSQRCSFGRDLEISDTSERELARSLRDLPVEMSAYDIGEVSFHAGWTFHRAGPNQTAAMRGVMTVIYMDAAMRLAQPANRNQESDWRRWCPGAEVGQVIDSPLNPVIWRR